MFRLNRHRLIGAIAIPVIAAGIAVSSASPSAAMPESMAQAVQASQTVQTNLAALQDFKTVQIQARSHRVAPRVRVYRWAHTQVGCPYVWGGTGPCNNGYDCSGLVMKAWEHVNIYVGRTTEDMSVDPHLKRLWHPAKYARKGDIVLFFSGGVAFHAGLVAYKNRWMLDAPHSGENVGVHRINWGDPVFYKVKR
jgi:cell wall-associated NlpC family hydrolase